jgi:hypothetical protein
VRHTQDRIVKAPPRVLQASEENRKSILTLGPRRKRLDRAGPHSPQKECVYRALELDWVGGTGLQGKPRTPQRPHVRRGQKQRAQEIALEKC